MQPRLDCFRSSEAYKYCFLFWVVELKITPSMFEVIREFLIQDVGDELLRKCMRYKMSLSYNLMLKKIIRKTRSVTEAARHLKVISVTIDNSCHDCHSEATVSDSTRSCNERNRTLHSSNRALFFSLNISLSCSCGAAW